MTYTQRTNTKPNQTKHRKNRTMIDKPDVEIPQGTTLSIRVTGGRHTLNLLQDNPSRVDGGQDSIVLDSEGAANLLQELTLRVGGATPSGGITELPKAFFVKVKGEHHYRAIQEVLIQRHGFGWLDMSKGDDGVRGFLSLDSPAEWVHVDNEVITWTARKDYPRTNAPDTPVITYDDLWKAEPGSKPEIVKLNASHEAIVTKGEVKVGCQTFDPQVIRDLAASVERMNPTTDDGASE